MLVLKEPVNCRIIQAFHYLKTKTKIIQQKDIKNTKKRDYTHHDLLLGKCYKYG